MNRMGMKRGRCLKGMYGAQRDAEAPLGGRAQVMRVITDK